MSIKHSFAHISDVHIGAFRHPYLQKLVLDTFIKTLDICVQRKVEFIVIAGDLFDSNVPDMNLVDQAVKKMNDVRKKGIEIYVVYGSHDFSPTQSSMIDILSSASLFDKVTQATFEDSKLLLKFRTNQNTGAKLVGISGLKGGTEKQYYDILDRKSLEEEKGFKIFIFHGMISEYKPDRLAAMDSMPISYFPKNFNYYAGGHIHEKMAGRVSTFDNVVYPGALFGADLRDIENSARGQKRGFFIVTFSDKVDNIDFIEVSSCEYSLLEYNAEGKTSLTVQKDLTNLIKESEIKGKVVILKVKGEMTSGKTSDINFSALEKILYEKGATHTMISRRQLTSTEYSAIRVTEYDTSDIERRIFKESIGSVKISRLDLKGEKGIKLSLSLLKTLKQDKKNDELKRDYEIRITNDSIDAIGLKEELNN